MGLYGVEHLCRNLPEETVPQGVCDMSRKGMQASMDYNKRRLAIRHGTGKPIEYTLSVQQALKAAGLTKR